MSSAGIRRTASARLRDGGRKALVIAIGGPDGHDPALRGEADLVLSFGALTWPHQMVRIMLAEQLYRAATILSGHPYHRGLNRALQCRISTTCAESADAGGVDHG